MPVKVKPRPTNSLRADQTANIPTTIKNPERVAHRRTELIEVATKLFLERGFHNTSIRDIVRACSFNIASLYMYVSSKEDILYLVAQDLMNNIARELGETALTQGSAREALEHGFSSFCRISDRLRRPIRLLFARWPFCRKSAAPTFSVRLPTWCRFSSASFGLALKRASSAK
jgi:AcrR family transcriptional regulator